MHESVIDRVTFENVQRILEKTRQLKARIGIVYETTEALSEKMNREEKELLEQLRDAKSEELNLYAVDRFIYGYRLGALMIMELFTVSNDFIFGEEGKKRYGEFENLQRDSENDYAIQHFTYGFSLGVRLMIETLEMASTHSEE